MKPGISDNSKGNVKVELGLREGGER